MNITDRRVRFCLDLLSLRKERKLSPSRNKRLYDIFKLGTRCHLTKYYIGNGNVQLNFNKLKVIFFSNGHILWGARSKKVWFTNLAMQEYCKL